MPSRRRVASSLLATAMFAKIFPARAQPPWRDLPAAPGPLDNPLKGWAPYAEDWSKHHLPAPMVYFYVSWRELEPRPGQYAFEAWEKSVWARPLAAGKHIVFRVYLDYPGKPTGVPQWLLDRGVTQKEYRGSGGEPDSPSTRGLSPDYGHPELVAGLERLIAAMGKRYDKHPRVGFIALGLLGHWGEWHTYPRQDLAAPAETEARVVRAYRRAFPNKLLLARYPRGAMGEADWLGYHDDAFPDSTGGEPEWHFLNQMRKAGRLENWKRAPIGAEMIPNQAKRLLGPDFERTATMVERAHVSWMGPYNPALEGEVDDEFRARAAALVRKMGYEFRLTRLAAPAAAKRGASLAFKLALVNQGVAPFYYPWPVEAALLDEKGAARQRQRLAADPRRWLPGEADIAGALRPSVPPGRYDLALGILDPWTGRPAIGFANALPRKGGWTALAPVTVG